MTETPPVLVTYIGLPISSGGAHSLGRMSRRDAYQKTMSFLQTCTQPVTPVEFTMTVHTVPELRRQRALERELKRRFGRGRHVLIPAARVPDALDYLDDIHPQPTNQWGMAPIWFNASAEIRILDPATGRAIPGQDPDLYGGVEYEWRVPLGSSRVHLSLDNKARLGVELCVPAVSEDIAARVVPWLQQHLPCRLSPKQWRAWTPTKTGSFKARRIAAPSQPA